MSSKESLIDLGEAVLCKAERSLLIYSESLTSCRCCLWMTCAESIDVPYACRVFSVSILLSNFFHESIYCFLLLVFTTSKEGKKEKGKEYFFHNVYVFSVAKFGKKNGIRKKNEEKVLRERE